ncbi:hypothetical protein [Streptomyces sp. NPDC050560]|uniref:hypothetical protein n=1 Tax=Streptomyces sp. NPDC050560 TaxID=3365630 RepID=UPI00378F8E61
MTASRRTLGTGPRSTAQPAPLPAEDGAHGPRERGTAAERAAAEPHPEHPEQPRNPEHPGRPEEHAGPAADGQPDEEHAAPKGRRSLGTGAAAQDGEG